MSRELHRVSWGEVSRDEPRGSAEGSMSLNWIAQRLQMGSWTCVSDLLRETPASHPQAQEVLPSCQKWGLNTSGALPAS